MNWHFRMERLPLSIVHLSLLYFSLTPTSPRVRSCECERIHEVSSFLSLSPTCDPAHLRSPDDVTPNCRRSALRLSFHRPRSQMEYSAGYLSWPPIAGYSNRGRINIFAIPSLIDRPLHCTKIIICPMICSFQLLFVRMRDAD